MDTSLQLRIKFDNKESGTDTEINTLLEQSKVIQKLTRDYEEMLSSTFSV